MIYQQTTDHCFGKYGVDKAAYEGFLTQLAAPMQALAAGKNEGAAPLLTLPSLTADLAEIETLAAQLRARFKTVIVAGSGGSGLSGKALLQLKLMATMPAFHFLENIDPDCMEDVLSRIDVENTCFLIISKSGTTVETLSQYYVLRAHVEANLGRKGVAERFVMVTIPGDNPMRASAKEYGLRVLDHDPDVGGRYAILSVVGLLPAAIAGLDIRALRRGGQSVVEGLKNTAPAGFAPAVGAALQFAFMQKNTPMSVMLPYAEKLAGFSSWYRQNWAESLGKNGKGSTPIRALGTIDQHSQLQLYLDGPKDKFFTMVMIERAGKGPRIDAPAIAELDYLRGKTMGDVMSAQQKGTFESLVRSGCPVRLFSLSDMKEEQLGALLMHFTIEIILTASLMQINPFDQPAVEEGKILARNYLLTGTV